MTVAVGKEVVVSESRSNYRWVQLLVGIVCMTMIANLQYGWTLFVGPLHAAFGWKLTSIQVAFTIFVVCETWLVPFEGYFEDLFGPKPLIAFGGVLVAVAWVLNSQVTGLSGLYIAQAIGGIGAGAIYGTCVGNAVKWFPDHRGLAAGLTAAGFGIGSALTIVPISNVIVAHGYQSAFLYFGLVQGIVVCICALLFRSPSKAPADAAPPADAAYRQFSPREMLRTPLFWLLYAMFVMMAAGGLMATAQLAPIAKDFGVAKVPVSFIGFTLPALTFALALDRTLNGLTRPFFGWVSDRIGRESTMFLAFGVEGLAILALSKYGHTPGLFVLLSGLVFFGWGEIYSLFPATCTDSFGTKFATTNAGLLYTAKGTAALLVPFSSKLTELSGSWHLVFLIAAALNILTALLAIFVLRPLRRQYAGAAHSETDLLE
ncbi:oxalate/formate MFS antiporter [Methylovirgula ligni]|uniref:OFA family oxalate/formate antiporter-like MFS transporter n=1 Tax=Methylovirgula ligni TaxID=569860 RepID=A0A3D9YWX4_9HYPH|nr:oxalate/formate MFS antiporter [Methylovirgula ligni]QAY97331.1 oxalate/formate MFS antiporter [Methylovirgula ligni]REF86201.1 OFA family oxalate/formate antiporter-like MFS transporter [Methylovirgula ligni]